MSKTPVVAAVAFLSGGAAILAFTKLHAPDAAGPAPVIGKVPALSRAAAESHRDDRYRSLHTVEQTMALPGDFAQTEALYTLAGRSDSPGVQNLIFQADGIADPLDRRAALDILFSRLTELDPRSALALSRTGGFQAERHLEAGVWHSWAKLDLDSALAAASALDSSFERHAAAQAMYAAYGYQGNETTDHIERILGIPPNSSTRAGYLFRLAERSPAEAVAVINSLTDPAQQHEAATYLGRHLGRIDGTAAARHAGLFRDKQLQQQYRHAVAATAAEADPESVLDELLAQQGNMQQTMEAHTALRTVASRDVEKALAYLDRIGNPRHRAMLASAIGPALAQADPDRALAWAKENDRSGRDGLIPGVLAAIASAQPEKAIEEALQLRNALQRQQALSMIAMSMSRSEPQQAIALLGRIEQPRDRRNVAENIAGVWIQSDPDAALSWILQMDGNERHTMLAMSAQMLSQFDLDSAMRWLPRLDEQAQALWRSQIAANLASQRSAAEALQFISRYAGSDDYPQLLASAVGGIAETDMHAALQMAERAPEGAQKDQLYAGLVGRFSHRDPEQAAAILDSIADESQRAQATSMLVMFWSQSDPAGAEHWTEGLPRGTVRDDAIVQLASNWEELTPSRRLLVNSIGSLEKRKQALMASIQRTALTDPRQAALMLRDMDLTDDERRMIEQNISLMRAYP